MWVKVDDALTGHPKIFRAGRLLGPHGTGRALAIWLEALCWANSYATDGLLPVDVVERFQHDADPLRVAGALGYAGLWEPCPGGWRVHDFHEYQPAAGQLTEAAEQRTEAGKRGAAARWGKNGESHGESQSAFLESLRKNGETWRTNAMAMAKRCPVPDPDPVDLKDQDQDLPYAREQPAPPISREAEKAEERPTKPRGYRPSTKGARTCPHDPMCRSLTVCRDRVLAEAREAKR